MILKIMMHTCVFHTKCIRASIATEPGTLLNSHIAGSRRESLKNSSGILSVAPLICIRSDDCWRYRSDSNGDIANGEDRKTWCISAYLCGVSWTAHCARHVKQWPKSASSHRIAAV